MRFISLHIVVSLFSSASSATSLIATYKGEAIQWQNHAKNSIIYYWHLLQHFITDKLQHGIGKVRLILDKMSTQNPSWQRVQSVLRVRFGEWIDSLTATFLLFMLITYYLFRDKSQRSKIGASFVTFSKLLLSPY
jgi:predicted PurR-regulated permease PerM